MTHDEMIEVIRGHKDGALVQLRLKPGGEWLDRPNPDWDFKRLDYRLKPTTTRVPLGPEDFPPGTVIGNPSAWFATFMINREGIRTQLGFFSWDELAKSDVKRLAPGQVEWLPCWGEG